MTSFHAGILLMQHVRGRRLILDCVVSNSYNVECFILNFTDSTF